MNADETHAPETATGLQVLGEGWFHVERAQLDASDQRLASTFPSEGLETLTRWLSEGKRSRIDAQGDHLVAFLLVPVMQREEDRVWEHRLVLLATHDAVLTVADSPPGRPALDVSEVARHFGGQPPETLAP